MLNDRRDAIRAGIKSLNQEGISLLRELVPCLKSLAPPDAAPPSDESLIVAAEETSQLQQLEAAIQFLNRLEDWITSL